MNRRNLMLVLLLVLSMACSSIMANSSVSQGSFVAGTQAFKSSDFEHAAESFRQSALLRPASGTYQNLGLAEWQRSHVGAAVLAWEQALWLDPFNNSVRNNLRFARKAAQIENPELSWNEVISGWLPVNWWSWIVSSSLWLAIGAITVPTVLRRPKLSWHQGLAAFGAMLFLLSLPAQYGVHTRAQIGFVLAKGTALRLTPTRDSQMISQLPPAEPIRWVRARGDFVLVRTSRAIGWVERQQIGLICGRS
jgi:hypothetical protein